MKKILLLITLFTLPLFATNWYVDKNATGLNNGTSWTNAWESFADINWSSIDAGDYLYISGGADSTFYYETLSIDGSVKGTAANYIYIMAGKYSPSPSGHSGRVIIDCQDLTRTRSMHIGQGSPTPSYLYIKGFELKGGNSGIYIEDYGNCITIDSCYVYHYYDLAGVFTNSDVLGIDSITIKNCTIISDVNLGSQTDGIYIAGSTNTVIHNNYVRMRSQDEYAHVDCIQSFNTRGLVIYNNVLISDSVNSPEGGGMPYIVRSNGTAPVIVYNNYCYMGGIWYATGAQSFSFNVHAGDQDQGYGSASPFYAFHNTIVANGPRVAPVEFSVFGVNGTGVFLNNIAAQYDNGTRYTVGTSVTIDVDSVRNNLFWDSERAIQFAGNWTNGSTTNSGFNWAYWTGTLGGTGLNQDPLLVDNYGYEPDQGVLTGELQATSPAINAGEDLTYLKNYLQSTYGIVVDIEHDINGLTRDTENPTIGAYEYQSGEPTPAQTKKVRVIIIQ